MISANEIRNKYYNLSGLFPADISYKLQKMMVKSKFFTLSESEQNIALLLIRELMRAIQCNQCLPVKNCQKYINPFQINTNYFRIILYVGFRKK